MWLERSVWLFMCVEVRRWEKYRVEYSVAHYTVFFLHLSFRLEGILITPLQYRFSSLTFSLSCSCLEPKHTYFLLWIPFTCLHLPHKFSFLLSHAYELRAYLSLVTLTQREDANKALYSTNSLFIQRAQQSPLATSILVYLPSAPSYDCHDNVLVAMPVFRCHCVVFVAAVWISWLVLNLSVFPTSPSVLSPNLSLS